VQGLLPGSVQIWSGYIVRTAPGWILYSRGVVNKAKTQPFENYEGIFESDTWFGPQFTQIRILRPNSPIEFHMRYPFMQVQPLLRQCYREHSFEVLEATDLDEGDWRRFETTIKPNTDKMRRLGHHAVEVRKRLRSEPPS
jgi:hypothetical protein